MPAVLEIFIKAIDQTTQTLAAIGKSTDGLGGSLNRTGVAMGKLSSAASSAAIPIGVAVVAIDKFSDAALQDETSIVRLQQAVKAAGVGWDKYGGQLEETAKQGMRLGFSDEQVRDGLSLLIAGTGSAEEAMKRLAIAQDVTRGTGIDLSTTSRLLTKVTEESVNVFARYGIRLKEGMTQQEALTAVQAKFAGQAEAFADSNAGAIARQKIQMDELQEALGKRLVPAITALFAGFNSLPGPMQLAIVGFAGFGLLIAPAIAGIISVTVALGGLITSLFGVAAAMVVATGGLILIIPALIAIGVAAYVFRDEIMSVFNTVKDFVERHAVIIAAILMLVFPFAGVALLAYKFRDEIMSVFNSVKGFVANNAAIITGIVSVMFPFVGVAVAAYKFRDEIASAFNSLIGFVSGAGGALSNLIVEPFRDARTAIQWVINKIHDLIDAINSIPSLPDLTPGFSADPRDLFRAAGGPVSAGGSYIVGERGPEWFIPKASGTIVPNMGGGGNTYIAVPVTYAPQFSDATPAEAERFGALVAKVIRREMNHS